ncbi:hypothetical protein FRC17_001644 [Serendipita sp. 399]|nr:hypothetical protein FRC17_001644 [Serendipita sp. 399]
MTPSQASNAPWPTRQDATSEDVGDSNILGRDDSEGWGFLAEFDSSSPEVWNDGPQDMHPGPISLVATMLPLDTSYFSLSDTTGAESLSHFPLEKSPAELDSLASMNLQSMLVMDLESLSHELGLWFPEKEPESVMTTVFRSSLFSFDIPLEDSTCTFSDGTSTLESSSPTASCSSFDPFSQLLSNGHEFCLGSPCHAIPNPSSDVPFNISDQNDNDDDGNDANDNGAADSSEAHLSQLERELIQQGASDKIDQMKSIQHKVFQCESSCDSVERLLLHDDVIRRNDTNEEGVLLPSLFAPFFKQLRPSFDKKAEKKWVCHFCKHKLTNRTQMVQHVMGLHFRYYPFKCAISKWYVDCANFPKLLSHESLPQQVEILSKSGLQKAPFG